MSRAARPSPSHQELRHQARERDTRFVRVAMVTPHDERDAAEARSRVQWMDKIWRGECAEQELTMQKSLPRIPCGVLRSGGNRQSVRRERKEHGPERPARKGSCVGKGTRQQLAGGEEPIN